MDPVIHFASDTHFGAGSVPGQKRRVELFLRWLSALEDGSTLYLLGDIFDFWLDYPSYMPKEHMEILYGLKKAQERDIRLRFVGGNHDIWCGDFLRGSLDVDILPNGVVVEHQGQRLRLHHGDGLLAGDTYYKAFRGVVRNRVLVFLAKSLHPELLHRFAHALSHHSREKDRPDSQRIVAMIREYASSHSHADVDHFVVGHIHTPHQEKFGAWTFHCLGDWVTHSTAGELRDGRFSVYDVRDRLDR
jgi:UDP-2,3-diacylglucosamine hydrolase